jgi:transposase
VIAPSLIPKKPGNHVKTDRRDAKELLTLMEAGLLTPIRIPTVQEEALRDLVRSRMDMQKCLTMQKHRLNQFMQRHGRIFPGKTHWTREHDRWLGHQEFSEIASQRTAEFYRRWVEQGKAELARVDEAILELGPQYKESYALAERLICFQGIDKLSGIGLACELMDLRRFSKATELMAYTGLTGREYSSADVIKRRGITKAGNAHVRHMLIQAAWKYIHQPDRVCQRLREHWKTQPAALQTLSQKAKNRLYKRYWHLVKAGKAPQKAIVAVARELTGFLWAAAHVETTAA